MKRRIFLTGILWPRAASAHSFKLGDILIGHAWALPSRQNDGQVFFPLVNNGKAPDELVAARSGICAQIELRQNAHYDDPPLKSLALDPGKPIPMRPTARHLRLIGLRKPLEKGDGFTMILDFLNAGEIEIEVHVANGPSE
jgi:periplasmic copper chaperone A